MTNRVTERPLYASGVGLVAFIGLAVAVASFTPASITVTMVRNGKPQVIIAVAFVVEELSGHIKNITGANLPVSTDDQPIRGTRGGNK